MKTQSAGTDALSTTRGGPALTEDWLAVCLGLCLFVLSLRAFSGVDLLDWAVTCVWGGCPEGE